MTSVSAVLFSAILLAMSSLQSVKGHGFIVDPPARASMWRFGFGTPKNYDDMGLNCGGREAQHGDENKGRCGECGDEWKLDRPRPNDEGGLYGTGVIGQTYIEGSVIRTTINITANHFGYFEFRLCPKQSSMELVTQECLDRYPLEFIDYEGQGTDVTVEGTRFTIGSATGYYFPTFRLPAGVTCENCVLQWYWTTANSPDQLCDDGTIGYCKQESFVNCADVSIVRQP